MPVSKISSLVLGFLLLVSGSGSCSELLGDNDPPELIPRAELFGGERRYSAELSPNGEIFAYRSWAGGAPNIWLGSVGRPDDSYQLTHSPIGFSSFQWSADNDVLILFGDNDGDERYRLWSMDITTGDLVALTPGQGERASVLAVGGPGSAQIVITSNERDPEFSDVYRVNIHTGEREVLFINEAGYGNFYIDEALRVVGAQRTEEVTGDILVDRVEGDVISAWLRIAYEDTRTFQIVSASRERGQVLALDSTGHDTARLVVLDLYTGARDVLAQSDQGDIIEVEVRPGTISPIAYAVDYDGKVWTPLADDSQTRATFRELERRDLGRVDIAGWTSDYDAFIAYVSGDVPSYHMVVELETARFRPVLEVLPDLGDYEFSPNHARHIETSDGQIMVAWLSLPVWSDPDENGMPDQPLPTILLPHGGPWDQSRESFDAYVQWLTNRGYAVIRPNFRGSTGYGKAWLNGGDLEWGGRIQQDVEDAALWAIESGIADEDRLGIWGASFGGYMALRMMSSSPDLFACGASSAGPTELATLYYSLPEYWTAYLSEYRRRVGDPTTPEGLELIRAHSPLYDADRIRRPLLIATGENDSRVPTSEAEQMVSAMQESGTEPIYVLFRDTGHGSGYNADNDMGFMAITEHFFAQCLAGRSEPFGDVLSGTTIEVPVGADLLPGLPDALRDTALAE